MSARCLGYRGHSNSGHANSGHANRGHANRGHSYNVRARVHVRVRVRVRSAAPEGAQQRHQHAAHDHAAGFAVQKRVMPDAATVHGQTQMDADFLCRAERNRQVARALLQRLVLTTFRDGGSEGIRCAKQLAPQPRRPSCGHRGARGMHGP